MPSKAVPGSALPPPAEPPQQTATGVVTVAIILMAIAALYLGRDIFVPFALAVLLSFMLAPVVAYLRRFHIPRVPAVVLVVTSALAIVAALSLLVGTQAMHIAENLPNYQITMQEKVRALRETVARGGVIERTTDVINAISKELSSDEDEDEANDSQTVRGGKKGDEPITVRVEPPSLHPLETLRSVVGPLLGPITGAGITVVFVIFMLLEQNDMRDRFIRLVGGNVHRTTEALDEAASRVGRYLFMQLVVNATYGIPIGIGLYFIGVPGAFIWGLLATLLRFVPYLGPFIAAIFPVVLAFAVDPGWDLLAWTVALFVTMELISNNIAEPLLYGSSTGLSPVAVILAAIFWTLLWGAIGLILSTPLTVCLVVIGRYVPQLAFLGILLSKEPALESEERLYQRLLAGNVEEAMDISEQEVSTTSLLDFYGNVCIPALGLAENDRHRGATTSDRRRVAEGMEQIIHDLREQEKKDSPDGDADETPLLNQDRTVLCIAGRWELDAASAAIVEHSLDSRGVNARHVPTLTISPETIGDLDLNGVEILCVSYYDQAPLAYARFACRRLKRRMPQLKIVLGLWNLGPEAGSPEELAKSADADFAATTLNDLVRYVEEAVTPVPAVSMQGAPIPSNEKERLEAVYASGLMQSSLRDKLDQAARKIAEAFGMPIALVSLINEDSQIWKGAAGLDEKRGDVRHGPRQSAICSHVVAQNATVIVPNLAHAPQFAENPFVHEQDVQFYAGVPLRTAEGLAIGALCLMDTKPRLLNGRDIKLLQLLADELMENDAPAHSAPDAPAGTQKAATP